MKVGAKVIFPRGMFGPWDGVIKQLYTGRGRLFGLQFAMVAFKRANGSSGVARVLVANLTEVP